MHLSVTGARNIVDENGVITDDRIVSDMGIDHQEDAVADKGGSIRLGGGVNCGMFADEAAFANFYAAGGHTHLELEVLCRKAERSSRVDGGSIADVGWAMDVDVADEVYARAEFYRALNDAERADDHIICKNSFL